MEKERRVKALAIVVLVIAVLGLTIAFAALSQTLTINGSAKLDASKWGLKFENLSSPTTTGDASIVGEAKINESTYVEIANMNVRLTTPGDKVVYTVDLVNEGSINAKIDEIVKTTTPNYLSFKVYMGNTGNDELEEGYVLGKETRIPLRIEIEFIKDITKDQLPTEVSTIDLSYKVNFVQTDEDATSIGQTPTTACTTFEKKDTYNVGDEIALCNNDTNKSEDFYVISDNGDTVTALAKYNLLVGNIYEPSTAKLTEISTEIEGYGLQNSSARGAVLDNTTWTGIIAFAENKNNDYGYWAPTGNLLSTYGTSYPAYVFDENSLLYEPLTNYKSYIKTTLGKTSVNTSLLTYEQALALGCTTTCEAAPSWVYETSYWLGSARNANTMRGVKSYGDLDFAGNTFYVKGIFGLRPVITISKTD